jgi:hypothetical protein
MENENSKNKESSRKGANLFRITEEHHSFNDNSNKADIFNHIYNKNNNIINRNNNKKDLLKRKIMVSLLKEMDKNTNICLNNINSINFIYQIYGKGINIIQHEKNELNKTQSIMNCMRKHKFYTQINTNKNYKTSKLSFVSAENNKFHTFYSTDKLILSNKSKHKPNLINKSRKKPLKRSNSCCINNPKKNHKENFVLLPLKNILLKKSIENFNHIPVMPVVKHKTRTSIIYKKREIIEEEKEREYKNNLKLFSIKYEKEKEDFSNILFDECVELRKKKFKLDSFIKRFTNKHFVEKLYRIKENALQKNQ